MANADMSGRRIAGAAKRWRRIFFIFFAWLLIPRIVLAHVGYVVSAGEMTSRQGPDFVFLLSPLTQPFYPLLMIGTAAAAVALFAILKRHSFVQRRIAMVRQRAGSYEDLIPWMLRLGLGIALIGAGVAKDLVSPALGGLPHYSFAQILLGFLMLSGAFLAPALWGAVLLFLFALPKDVLLAGNIDFLAACAALLMIASGKPGIDDLLGLPLASPLKSMKAFVPLILRIGIGGAMVFLAFYEKFLNPRLSAAVVENYRLAEAIPVSVAMWVLSAGLIEFAVGFALLVGLQTRLFAAIAFIVLSLSFFYFGEAMYSHVTLFAALSALFVTGGGRLSVDNYLGKRLSGAPKALQTVI